MGVSGTRGPTVLVRRAVLGVVATLMSATVLVVALPRPASASCAGELADLIADMETVFVATALEQGPRFARVEVDEVWRGPDLAPSVSVQTAAAVTWWPLRLVEKTRTSVDAELVPGTRYLIATHDGFRTNACLVAPASDPFVDRLAPQDAREPVATGQTGANPSNLDGPLGVVLALVILVVLPIIGGSLAYRRLRAAGDTHGE